MVFIFTLVLAIARVSCLTSEERAKFSGADCFVAEAVCDNRPLASKVSTEVWKSFLNITSNAVPDHATCFQCGRDNPCDTLDARIRETVGMLSVPMVPSLAAEPACVPDSIIGIMTNGVPLRSSCGVNLASLDGCLGRPAENRQYSYWTAPVCMRGWADAFMQRQELFIGVAVDGFPIYNSFDSQGNFVSNDVLDVCHGYDPGTGYRYIANDEPPYVIGCLRGKSRENQWACGACNGRQLSSEEPAPVTEDAYAYKYAIGGWYHDDGGSSWYFGWPPINNNYRSDYRREPVEYAFVYKEFPGYHWYYHYVYVPPPPVHYWNAEDGDGSAETGSPTPGPVSTAASTTPPFDSCPGTGIGNQPECGTNNFAGNAIDDFACWRNGGSCVSSECAEQEGSRSGDDNDLSTETAGFVSGTTRVGTGQVFFLVFFFWRLELIESHLECLKKVCSRNMAANQRRRSLG